MSTFANLQGKVAIVTGSSRGIGREVAITLARQGASVVVNYQGNVKAADEVVCIIQKAGGKATAVKADVSDSDAVKALFDKAEEAFGHVNILVHMAGILLGTYPTAVNTSEEDWDRIFAVNAKGTFVTNREAVKRLVSPGGRIVNAGSTLVATLLPGYSAYTASKAAVEAFTKTLAKELRGKKITVNAVAPGPVRTDMFLEGKTEEMLAVAAKAPPLERLGETRDIASVVLFIVSDEGEWLNGQVVRVNGGVAS